MLYQKISPREIRKRNKYIQVTAELLKSVSEIKLFIEGGKFPLPACHLQDVDKNILKIRFTGMRTQRALL